MQSSWGVILNPRAGNKKVSGKMTILDALKASKLFGEYKFTEYAGHATVLARKLVAAGYRKIAVVGGDGSVSEVVDGLMTSNIDTQELTFAVIPSGTGNDWCRYWHTSHKVDECLRMIQQGKTATVDVGLLTFRHKDQEVYKYFINSVGFGFDAEIVYRAERIGNVLKGQSTNYFLGLLVSMFTCKSKQMVMKADHDTFCGEVFTMNVANGPYTGGGIKQTPNADPTDGMFDMLLASRPNPYQLVRDVSRVLFRQSFGGVLHTYRTKKVEITSPHFHTIEADGIVQPLAKSPILIELVPSALKMIVG